VNIEEYVEHLRKRYRWRRKRIAQYILFPALIAGIVVLGGLGIVQNPTLFAIPQNAAEYLLNTPFYHFSVSELATILRSAHDQPAFLLVSLLIIYWSYHVALFFLFLLMPFALSIARQLNRRDFPKYKESLFNIAYLQDLLKKQIAHCDNQMKMSL